MDGKTPIAITKSQIARSISTDYGLSQRKAEKSLSILYNIIKTTLLNGESISIRGFGKFYVKYQRRRKIRHPSTGKIIIAEPKKSVKFIFYKSLDKEINLFDEFERQNEIILRHLYELIEKTNDYEDEKREIQEFEKRDKVRKKYKSIVTIEDMKVGDSQPSQMINYSEDGLHFESSRLLQPGTEVFIRLDDSPYFSSHDYEGRRAKIIWGRRKNQKSYIFNYGAKYISEPIGKSSKKIDLKETKQVRNNPRKLSAKEAYFRLQGRICSGIIRNVSRGGCFIETSESLHINQNFALVVPGNKKIGKNLILKAETVWLSPVGVGVKYKKILRTKFYEFPFKYLEQ